MAVAAALDPPPLPEDPDVGWALSKPLTAPPPAPFVPVGLDAEEVVDVTLILVGFWAPQGLSSRQLD